MKCSFALPLLAIAFLPSLALPEGRSFSLDRLLPTKRNEIVAGQIKIKFLPARAAEIEASAKLGLVTPDAMGERFLSRIPDTGWTIWQVPAQTDIRWLCAQLSQRPDVLCAEPVNKVYALVLPTPDDPDYTYTETDPNLVLDMNDEGASFRRLWNLDDINAYDGWAHTLSYWPTATKQPSNHAIVAIIDTGCDMNHPDFIRKGGTGTDYTQGGQFDKSLSAYFHLGQVVPGASVEDLNGHGTHVTGIALAAGNNGPFSASVNNGMIGIGHTGRGMILRVFDDQGNASDTDAASAIIYAANNGADIINLSLGTENYSQVFQDAVTYAFQKGCAVFAAGNEDGNGGGDLGPIYPAACSGACAVTAAGPDHTIANAYAGSGNYIDIAAPGGNINVAPDLSAYKIQFVWSTAMRTQGELYNLSQQGAVYPPYDLNYAYLAGTSMACPHVSGAAALYYGRYKLSKAVSWSNVKVYRALERSAQGLGAPDGTWETNFGYGELDLLGLISNSDARLAGAGAIQGIVYYNSTPVANVSVKAKIGGVTFGTTTHQDGTYRFDALPPGKVTMTAVPFGAVKTKTQTVVAGSDTPGVDFWCGTYTGDTTNPVVAKLNTSSRTTAQGMVNYQVYDTETGIDKVTLKIGTTSGASNVASEREVNVYAPAYVIKGSFTIGATYYLTMTYTNGNNVTKTKILKVVW